MTNLVLTNITSKKIATLSLNRPDVHNVLDRALITELTQSLQFLNDHDDVRVVILKAEGRSFCAGADISMMKTQGEASGEENCEAAEKLSELMHTLYTLNKPTVAMVQGPAYGGGVGLVSCVDIAIASDSSVFGFPEAKLGLVPAIISPYVISCIGERVARRYFLTGERFGAMEACRIGLVHEVVSPAELEPVVEHIIRALLDGGPQAQNRTKKLISYVAQRADNASLRAEMINEIAECCVTDEAKEGLSSFLEKRLPAWRDKNL